MDLMCHHHLTPTRGGMETVNRNLNGLELATDRSASTWKAHFDTLKDHHFHSLGMASDRGIGLVAGYRDACPDALWVGDHFHEFRGLFEVRLQWEKKAYSTIA